MPRVRPDPDVLEAWQQFLESCLSNPGDAAKYGKMRAQIEGLPKNARVYADSFRAYRRKVRPPMPGPHAVQAMGRVLRAMKLSWCSDLLLLYASSHLSAFVELIIGTEYGRISPRRYLMILAALPKSIVPLNADSYAHFSEIADLSRRKFQNRLDREDLPVEYYDDYNDELVARAQIREKATLTLGEHALFEKSWENYVNFPRQHWTDRSGFVMARLVAQATDLSLKTQRELTLYMLCREFIAQEGVGLYVPPNLRVPGLPN